MGSMANEMISALAGGFVSPIPLMVLLLLPCCRPIELCRVKMVWKSGATWLATCIQRLGLSNVKVLWSSGFQPSARAGLFSLASCGAPNWIGTCAFYDCISLGVGGNLPVDGALFQIFYNKRLAASSRCCRCSVPLATLLTPSWPGHSFTTTAILLIRHSVNAPKRTIWVRRYLIIALSVTT